MYRQRICGLSNWMKRLGSYTACLRIADIKNVLFFIQGVFNSIDLQHLLHFLIEFCYKEYVTDFFGHQMVEPSYTRSSKGPALEPVNTTLKENIVVEQHSHPLILWMDGCSLKIRWPFCLFAML